MSNIYYMSWDVFWKLVRILPSDLGLKLSWVSTKISIIKRKKVNYTDIPFFWEN